MQEGSAGSHAGKGAGRGDVVEREGGSCSSVPLEQSTYSKPAEGLTAHSAPSEDSRSSRTRRSLHRSDKHLSETARCTTSRRDEPSRAQGSLPMHGSSIHLRRSRVSENNEPLSSQLNRVERVGRRSCGRICEGEESQCAAQDMRAAAVEVREALRPQLALGRSSPPRRRRRTSKPQRGLTSPVLSATSRVS